MCFHIVRALENTKADLKVGLYVRNLAFRAGGPEGPPERSSRSQFDQADQ
jgi:hypothetical protein